MIYPKEYNYTRLQVFPDMKCLCLPSDTVAGTKTFSAQYGCVHEHTGTVTLCSRCASIHDWLEDWLCILCFICPEPHDCKVYILRDLGK